jgi:site-specific recombinase XerD
MRLFKRHKNGQFLSWYVEFDNGRRKSLKTKDSTAAHRAYQKVKRAYFAGRVAKLTGQCTTRLSTFRDEYLKWAKVALVKSTFRANRLALNKLIEHAGENCLLDRVNKKTIDVMVAAELSKGNKIPSINNYIRHARTVMNTAAAWEYVQKNPLADVKELSEPKRRPRFIEKSQIGQFLKNVSDIDLRRMIVAYIATGRRRSELLQLEWTDVDLRTGRYTVRHETSKSHLDRSYPINLTFRSVLESIGAKSTGRVFDRWQHPDTVSHQVKLVLVKAGFPALTLHSLRHTFASLKAGEGRSLKEIQELLGQSDIKATQIYSHLTEDHLAGISEVNIGPVDLVK